MSKKKKKTEPVPILQIWVALCYSSEEGIRTEFHPQFYWFEHDEHIHQTARHKSLCITANVLPVGLNLTWRLSYSTPASVFTPHSRLSAVFISEAQCLNITDTGGKLTENIQFLTPSYSERLTTHCYTPSLSCASQAAWNMRQEDIVGLKEPSRTAS